MSNFLLANIFAYIVCAITITTRLSKLYGLYKFKCVEKSNITPSLLTIFTIGFVLYYNICYNLTAMIISNVSNLVLEIIILFTTLYYIKKNNTVDQLPT